MSVSQTELLPAPTSPVLPGASLTLREKSLVDNYLQVKIKWKAAKLAGYTGTMQSLCQTAIDTLKKPEVAAYYQLRLEELHVSANELLAEVSEVVRTPLDAAVQKKTGVRVADKLKAGEMVGKWLGLERHESEVHLSDESVNQLLGKLCAVLDQARQQLPPEVEGELVDGPTTDCVDQPD